ncbi:MAG: putative Phosphate regulon transcriptional regulatory protein PhoB [Nitrospira sp.]|jgi:DNA-binding response OmpR family regulator|nr:putative Phosphate regulon transcriptional regulatory protein PhoB [Nitrospira sp.]
MIQSTISIVFVTTDNAGAYNLEKVLKSNGYRLMVAETLSRALIEIRRVAPAIILLDRQLLAKEGIRRNQLPPAIPIIVLQPFEESCGPDDCVSELDAGFDQIVSSLRYRELIAHVRAILRRHHMELAGPSQLRVAGLAMDIARHEVTIAGAVVELTPKEFQILHHFLLSPGVVSSRQELLNRIWGEDYALEKHALNVYIHSLRQKIESDPSKPALIVTIRGIGYKLQASQ